MEKNAHSQSNAVSFAVTIFPVSGLTGSDLCLLIQEPYSVRRRLTNLQFREFFFLLYRRSRVFLWVSTAHMACLTLDEVNGALIILLQ